MFMFLSFFIRILYNNVSYRIELDGDELTGEHLIGSLSFGSPPPYDKEYDKYNDECDKKQQGNINNNTSHE